MHRLIKNKYFRDKKKTSIEHELVGTLSKIMKTYFFLVQKFSNEKIFDFKMPNGVFIFDFYYWYETFVKREKNAGCYLY